MINPLPPSPPSQCRGTATDPKLSSHSVSSAAMQSISVLTVSAQDPLFSAIPQAHEQNDYISPAVSSLRDSIQAAQRRALSLLYHRPIWSYFFTAKVVYERFKRRTKDQDLPNAAAQTGNLLQKVQLDEEGIASSGADPDYLWTKDRPFQRA
ncbi:hypothetical protein FRC00_007403 [Tulasnella sp. 408]|nr:hypothetical protein FRC00_007403 [Tulasnella sp. 408]